MLLAPHKYLSPEVRKFWQRGVERLGVLLDAPPEPSDFSNGATNSSLGRGSEGAERPLMDARALRLYAERAPLRRAGCKQHAGATAGRTTQGARERAARHSATAHRRAAGARRRRIPVRAVRVLHRSRRGHVAAHRRRRPRAATAATRLPAVLRD